jgi:diguanylate cyclase (GGDEF)-like protein
VYLLSISRKLTLAVILSTAFTLILIFVLLFPMLLDSYEALEDDFIKRDISRIKISLDQKLEYYDSVSKDWANRDEIRDVFLNKNEVPSVVNQFVLETINVQRILFIDKDDNLIKEYSTYGSDKNISSGLYDKIINQGKTITKYNIDKHRIYISAKSKVYSDGDFLGTIVLVELVGNNEFIDDFLQENYKVTSVFATFDPSITESFKLVKTEDATFIKAYYEIGNDELIIVEAKSMNEILKIGKSSIRMIAFSIMIINVLTALVLIILVNVFTKKINDLKNGILQISSKKIIDHRIPLKGQDEVAVLSKEFNYMLDMIEEMTEDRIRSYRTDNLTKAFNRVYGESILETLIRTNKKFCISYIDMDNLKVVNDQYGHRYGDKILSALGRIIKENLGEHDIFIRIGGDEFIVACENNDEIYVRNLMHLVERKIIEYNNIEEFKIHISYGIQPSYEGMNLEKLLHLADQKMYVNKTYKKTNKK